MSENVHTTIATWVMPILSALKPFREGKDVLREVGIDINVIEDANQRITIEKMTHLWTLAEEISGDDCIGLEVIKYVSPTSFHALTYANQASSTIRESLERLIKFSNVISTAVSIELIDNKDNVVVRIAKVPNTMELSHHALDAFIGLMVKEGQQAINFNPNYILWSKLKRPKPRDTTRHEQTYNSPIIFNSNEFAVCFNRELVDQTIPSGNSELVRINEQVLAQYMSRFNRSDVVAGVYHALIELMPEGEPSREKVANMLGTTSRSLHRKLNDLNTSYKTILDDTRKSLALQYIRQTDISITTITYQLGFLDSSSFSRSFKRWTGLSPRDYRKELKQH
jgi:AraC-like DNA-binding protein